MAWGPVVPGWVVQSILKDSITISAEYIMACKSKGGKKGKPKPKGGKGKGKGKGY